MFVGVIMSLSIDRHGLLWVCVGDTMVHHVDLRRTAAGPPQHTESGRRVVLIRQWIRDCHSLLDKIWVC